MKSGFQLRINWKAVAIVTLLWIIIGAIFYLSQQSISTNLLQVSFLDIGQGDSIYIRTPHNREVLIDGGPGPVVLGALGSVMKWYDKSLDLIIATHPDKDHIAGLFNVLDNYTVGTVMDNGFTPKDPLDIQWRDKLKTFNGDYITARQGENITLDTINNIPITLKILWPTDAEFNNKDQNSSSVVAQLEYGKSTFMLTGDAGFSVEAHLVQDYGNRLNTDVLKLGHHGSGTSSSELFLNHVHPSLAIISAGKDNTYGHPSPLTMNRLKFLAIPSLLTIDEGTITLLTDGNKIWKE